ncbi:MAG: Npt1/Npt2 family nucleotide transporter [Proteobacteria bacterium]|nr:Npt1/Npt2 family nucleotide transporter [Pseudomonadota bacterium]
MDFKFQFLLSEAFVGQQDAETAFQGEFWRNLNATAVAAQFVLTPLLLTLIALRWVHLIMPLVQCGAIVWALLNPSIWSVGLAFFLFKVFDYSLFRGAKELVYLPLGFQARYRAKEFIDVFGYRTSKGGTALAIASVQKIGLAMHQYYLWIGLIFAGIWLYMVIPLTRNETNSPDEKPKEPS